MGKNPKKKKKKRRKRAWEIESDEEDKNDSNVVQEQKMSDRELIGYKKKFELFSEKATLLFANGDHNIYEQTRDSLIERIKLVEDEELFKKKQKEAMLQRNHNKKSEKEKMEDMLA